MKNLVAESIHTHVPEIGSALAVPHTIETTKLARNLGFKVLSPIMAHYDWANTTPFRTQRLTTSVLVMNPRAYVLSEMGTGKTRASLYAVDYLLQQGVINKALVVAPISTLTPTWDLEILTNFPHLRAGVVYGTKAQRKEVLQTEQDVYLINHHGVKLLLPELMQRGDIDAIIIDELAVYRNAGTGLWKAIKQLVRDRKYVWGMTGCPTPNAPTDAWAQVLLLTPHQITKSMRQFKQQTMLQVSQFRWVPRKTANDSVYAAMQPAVRFTRDETVELPPVSYTYRNVGMSAKQDQVYKELLKKLRLKFDQGELTAANEGVLFTKLMQIASGWVYTKDRSVVELGPTGRIDALLDILDETSGKVLVFADYIHVGERLVEILSDKGFNDVAYVSGDTSKRNRDLIFGAFQNTPSPRVIVAHPKCMSHGLSLTASNVIVWYTPTTSLETYIQACARISRAGQKKKQLIVHLYGAQVERRMYARLENKMGLQGALLEMFAE